MNEMGQTKYDWNGSNKFVNKSHSLMNYFFYVDWGEQDTHGLNWTN
jgi:hypothetical protein